MDYGGGKIMGFVIFGWLFFLAMVIRFGSHCHFREKHTRDKNTGLKTEVNPYVWTERLEYPDASGFNFCSLTICSNTSGGRYPKAECSRF